MKRMKKAPGGLKQMQYHCVKAAEAIYKVHSEGVPESHVDRTKYAKSTSGYYSNMELTCGARFLQVEAVVRGNKSIAKRLAQGDYLHVSRNPEDCLQREMANIYVNDGREINKKEEREAEELARAAGTAAEAIGNGNEDADEPPKKTRTKSKKRAAEEADEPKPKRRKSSRIAAEGDVNVDQEVSSTMGVQASADVLRKGASNPAASSSYPVPNSTAPQCTMIANPQQGTKREEIATTDGEAEAGVTMADRVQRERAAAHGRLMRAQRTIQTDTRATNVDGVYGDNTMSATYSSPAYRNHMPNDTGSNVCSAVPSSSTQSGPRKGSTMGHRYTSQLSNYAAGYGGLSPGASFRSGPNHPAFPGGSTGQPTIRPPLPGLSREPSQQPNSPLNYFQASHVNGPNPGTQYPTADLTDRPTLTHEEQWSIPDQNQRPNSRAFHDDEEEL
ncbi:Hypothetical predicted protein [Lecanosticta acicola]|uniref:Uncharacterized protein n=1 Tax=Lecanosticta acicola TaxID=111012 RepID=A0AAI8YXU1_9PEZI|nr:Hypothetical predicted protein [Lecanosticta acicola]